MVKVRTTLKLRFEDKDTIDEIGVDEAGRGSFWGPLMAAAVLWPPKSEWTEEHNKIAPFIQDSKLISKKKRVQLSEQIKKLAIGYGIGIVTSKEIDMMGISNSNREAFQRAIDIVLEKTEIPYSRIIIDGIMEVESITDKYLVNTCIDGDNLYLHVAAASILAKVAHDEYITTWCEKHPLEAERYNLLSCMGYGTVRHRNAIKEFGLLDEHRALFVRKTVGNEITQENCLITD